MQVVIMASSNADFKANNNRLMSTKVNKANDAKLKANDNPSENIEVEEALSTAVVPSQVQGIMSSYYNNDGLATSLYVNGKRLTVFGSDVASFIIKRTEAVALDHVISAGPQDALEAEVKKNPNVLRPVVTIPFVIAGEELVLRGTLEQLARMLGDLTVVTERGFVVPGCAETLRGLRQELLPDTMEQAVVEAKQVAVHDAKENPAHLAKLNEALPNIITDDRYFFEILQLLPMAFGVLAKRWNELKTGDQVERYCFEVLREVIEESLSDRQQQVAGSSVNALLKEDKTPERIVKRVGGRIIGSILDTGFFYDDLGRAHAGVLRRSLAAGWGKATFSLLISNYYFSRQKSCDGLVSQAKSRCVIM
jgi:hypothetical protein